MLDDRRKLIRFSVLLGLKFKLPKGANYFLGGIRNFSRKGFCFVSNNFNLQSKEILSCDIKLPGEDKSVSILGKTVWAKQINGNYLIGAELIEVDKEPIWRILDYAYKKWADARGYITNNKRREKI